MDTPLVSVIIPFYKNKKWLVEAIDSVVRQTYTNKEIIVIDDGSPEDISEQIALYKDVIYRRINNSGPGIARNIGIEIAKGEFIAFLDSDDYWTNNKLEIQIAFMLEHNLIWSHTAYQLFGENIKNKIIKMPSLDGYIFPRNVYSSKIATPCVIVKAIILKEQGFFFAPDMKTGQDGFLWFLLSINYKIGYIDVVLTKVRIRGTNSARNVYSQIRARAQLYNKMKLHYPELVKKNISLLAKVGFIICKTIHFITRNIFKDYKMNRFNNFIFMFLYFFPWILFKISFVLEGKNQ